MRFPWNRAEAEMEREIAHHLHQLAAEYKRQGYSDEEALLRAKREFGGREQVKEQCRDERRWAWLTGLHQDMIFGFRIMRKAPVVTLAAVLSLALGIGANTAIVSLMDVVLWRDLPVPSPKQLLFVKWRSSGQFPRDIADGGAGSFGPEEGAENVADFFSYYSFRTLRQAMAHRAALAAFTGFTNPVSVSYAGRATVAQERGVSGNFFSTLEVKPELGRFFSDRDDAYDAPGAIVVSYRFWMRVLGADPAAIGRAIRIDNRAYVILGVLRRDFYGLVPGDVAEIYTPLHHTAFMLEDREDKLPLDNDRFWCVSILARLGPGVSAAQLRPALEVLFPTTWSRRPKDLSQAPRIRLYGGGRGLGFLRREFRNPLLLLGGLVALLLGIACTNIANLLLARGTARQKEVAMRISLGCSRSRLIRQFLTESAMLAAVGGAASIVIAYLTANLLGQFLAERDRFPITVDLDWRIVVIVGLTSALALLLFGLFPAWRLAMLGSAASLKEGSGSIGSAAGRKWTTGNALVLTQMAMSVVLVLSAVVFTRNLIGIESADPGFDRRNLILFNIRPGTSGYEISGLKQFYLNLSQQLSVTRGITQVGLASMRPMNVGGWWEDVRLGQQDTIHGVSINGISPGYLPLYVSHMIAGRNLSWADVASEAKVAVISEDLARKLGGLTVLGHTLAFTDGPPGRKPPEFEIIGIAPAIAATSLKERPFTVWLPLGKDANEITVVLRTSQRPQIVLRAVQATMRQIDRNLPLVDVATMEEQISKTLQRERMFATLCDSFGILALVLSIVGLYGVMAYNTSRRQGEIGVRLALGAMPRDVLMMVLREGLRLAVLGLLIGTPLVWLGGKYVQKELFRMKPLELPSVFAALGLLLIAAVVAVAIPAIRASALRPMDALRQE
jgi:macrolide transport system ATP-binding/permease protein